MNATDNNMTNRGIAMFRNGGLFVRGVAAVIIVAFGGLVTSPAIAATRAELQRQAQMAPGERSPGEKLNDTLLAVKAQLGTLAGAQTRAGMMAAAESAVTAESREAAREALKDLRAELRALDESVREEFRAVEQRIREHGLSDVILQRHVDAVAKYEAEANALLESLADIETAPADQLQEKAAKAFERLQKTQLRKSQQPFDPKHLPNRALQPDDRREPRTEVGAFIADIDAYDADLAIAANEGYDLSGLAGANDAAYLAPTTEVVLSDDIRAQAAALDHDPVKIYNWVRNNVKWQPSWGAVQDADLTLSAKQGNAFDIASLTIALLRASGIPARYVHGTIDVPEEKFRNWIGGFEHVNAAMEYAASGGIPITSVVGNGQVTKVRLEHVWVEAAIDFYPSRGAVNRAADRWVAFDPSFKQYEYLEGLDVAAVAGLDPQALTDEFVASGTVNEGESWATGFDPAVLRDVRDRAQQAMMAYLDQNLPNATMGDVIGGRRIIEERPPFLSGMPENRVLVAGNRFAELPDSLRQHITFGFGADIFGGPLQSQRFIWAALNNERITLSFRPATQADEDALQSLYPEGDLTDISQLPASVPSYLIAVVPELKVGDDVVMTGDAMKLGEELRFTFTPEFAGSGSHPNTYNVIAGSYLAVAVIAGNVSRQAVDEATARLAATKAALQTENPAQIDGLDREDLLGDMFHAGILGYYGQYLGLSHMAGLKQGAHHYLAAGLGSFGYEPEVDYLFGFPRSIHGGGAGMNIPMVGAYGYDHDGSAAGRQRAIGYVMQTGTLSSMLEHQVPEQMFSTPEEPKHGISAVKALAKASAQGQRVYEITPANQASVLPNIHLGSLAMSEIRNALAAGKNVVSHTDPVAVPGWTGAGYMIIDPETGSGAYKIAGGANGGFLDLGSILSMIFSMNFGFKSALIEEFGDGSTGAKKVVDVFETIGHFMALIGFLIGVVDILLTCDQSAWGQVLGMYIVMNLMVMLMVFIAGFFLGPFAVFLLGVGLELLALYMDPKELAPGQCT